LFTVISIEREKGDMGIIPYHFNAINGPTGCAEHRLRDPCPQQA
jgi:hypothetical protein